MLTYSGSTCDKLDRYAYAELFGKDISILSCFLHDPNLKAVGIGATVLNGYSYYDPLGNMLFHTNCEILYGFDAKLFRMVHLPNYDMNVGYEEYCSVGSPARNICDYLMYPDVLKAPLYIMDAIEGYYDEFNGDMTGVYDMMKYFGLERGLLDKWMKELWQGSNRFSIY